MVRWICCPEESVSIVLLADYPLHRAASNNCYYSRIAAMMLETVSDLEREFLLFSAIKNASILKTVRKGSCAITNIVSSS
jgi:hypothetical protein